VAEEQRQPRPGLAGRLGQIISQDRRDRAQYREVQAADGLILAIVAGGSTSLPFLNEHLPVLAHERGLSYAHAILDELDEIPRQKLARAELVIFDLTDQVERTREVVRQVRAARKRLIFTAHGVNEVPRNYTHIPCAVYNPAEPVTQFFLRKVAEGLHVATEPAKRKRGASGGRRGRPGKTSPT
jgi:hypothetical protein